MGPQTLSGSATAAADWVSVLLTVAAVAGRVLLSATFIQAGIQKYRYHAQLAGVISNYRLLPPALVPIASWLLPPAELVLGIALLAPSGWPALAAGCILVVFTAAIVINLARGRTYIDCGCFQAGLRQELGWELVWRNGALVAVALCSASFAVRPAFFSGVVAALFGLVGYVLYQALNALAANLSALRSLASR